MFDDIQVEEREVSHDVDTTNVLHDVVEYSRSRQVLNEEQTIVTLLIYITGLLPDHSDYAAGYITGGSSGGKTHMKQKVIDRLFRLTQDWLFTTTSSSAKGLIDSEEWDKALIAAMNELNKIPSEMLEFLKSVHGDDGGHDYTRNRPDPDSESGFRSVQVSSSAKPVTFMLADENKMEVEAELATRMIEIKVDETEEKNAAVHRMHWGHKNLTLKDTEHEYIFDADDVEYALQKHIANIPVDTPVVIPTGEGRFEGDTWDASAVTEPMFSFKRSQSSRASRMIKSLVKASALMNYHSRNRVVIDGEEHIVVEPSDVGNIIACRRTLLTVTHGLDEKKFAVLEAIIENGAPHGRGGSALQMTKKQLEKAMQENKSIATVSKSELKSITEELNEDYIIDITENPEDRRELLYVYDGGTALGAPDIGVAYEEFASVKNPISGETIEETITRQQRSLGAKTLSDRLDSQDDVQDTTGQETLSDASLGPVKEAVLEAMSAIDGATIKSSELDNIDYEHMTGIAPTYVEDEYVFAERPATPEDIEGTIFDPDHDLWPSGLNRAEVKAKVENAIGELQSLGRWRFREVSDGVVVVVE